MMSVISGTKKKITKLIAKKIKKNIFYLELRRKYPRKRSLYPRNRKLIRIEEEIYKKQEPVLTIEGPKN